MKRCIWLAVSLAATLVAQGAEFRNLDFDDGITNTASLVKSSEDRQLIYGSGPAADLLPGWNMFRNSTPLTTIGYNSQTFDGGPSPTLIDSVGQHYASYPLNVQGKYGLYFDGPLPSGETISVVQQGRVPDGAHYLVLGQGSLGFNLKVNGTRLDPSMSDPPFYYNISPYAGQTVELSLVVTGSPFQTGVGFVDNITFVVPEPSTWALLGLGTAMLIARFKGSFRW